MARRYSAPWWWAMATGDQIDLAQVLSEFLQPRGKRKHNLYMLRKGTYENKHINPPFSLIFLACYFPKQWGKGLQKNIYGNTTRDVEKLRMYRKTTWKSMKHLVCFQAAEIAALERWLSLLAATPPPRSPGSGPRFGVFMDCWCYRSGQPPGILLKYCK